MVRQALHPLTDRLKRHRDHRGGQDRQDEAGPCPLLQQGPDSHHDRHVHAGDERGQRPVNQRLVDHQVDVVEVVAEDGHTDGDRDGSDRPAGNDQSHSTE